MVNNSGFHRPFLTEKSFSLFYVKLQQLFLCKFQLVFCCLCKVVEKFDARSPRNIYASIGNALRERQTEQFVTWVIVFLLFTVPFATLHAVVLKIPMFTFV